jgi:hypothetical protein
MRVLCTLLLAFVSSVCLAQDRNSKIQSLMQAQGLLAMFEQQIAMGKQQARQQAGQIFDQMIGASKPPPDAAPATEKGI